MFKKCSYVLKQGASLLAQIVENLPAVQEAWVQSLVWEDTLEKAMQPTPEFLLGEFLKGEKLDN